MTEPKASAPRPGAPGAMVIIVSGPSGVGKDTVLRRLRQLPASPQRHIVVTYNTRAPRTDEVDGIHYHFVTDDDFARLRDTGQLLEASWVHDHWAGTPRDQVVAALTSGIDAILKIDVKGADAIARRIPDAVRIFIAPPSREVLDTQLRLRGTETPEEIRTRREDAEKELARQDDFDYVVVNETGWPDRAAREIDRVIAREHELHPDRRVVV